MLSSDTAVRSEQRDRSPHSPLPARRPPVAGYRLAGDLRPYLADREALGGPVLGCHDRPVRVRVRSADG